MNSIDTFYTNRAVFFLNVDGSDYLFERLLNISINTLACLKRKHGNLAVNGWRQPHVQCSRVTLVWGNALVSTTTSTTLLSGLRHGTEVCELGKQSGELVRLSRPRLLKFKVPMMHAECKVCRSFLSTL